MRFIRAFWGDLEYDNGKYKQEIQNIAETSTLNDFVYVWGETNWKYISSLGLKGMLVCKSSTEFGEDFLYNSDTYFYHKLDAIKRGCSDFGSVVFLDWDTRQVKPIDDTFYELLHKQNSKIQMPLYIYPKDYIKLVLNEWKDIPLKIEKYLYKQVNGLKKFNYSWNNCWVTPNAGFIYCTDGTVIEELFILCEKNKVNVASEEMSMVIYSKKYCKTIEEYIKRFEPLVCDAKTNSHFNQGQLKKLIDKQVNKNLYFIHD